LNLYRVNWCRHKHFFLTILFNFLWIYMFFYFINLFFLFYFLYVTKLLPTFSKTSFATGWFIINKYIEPSFCLKFILLQLSGLPPFLFFYVKFNFLILSLNSVIFYIQYLIFLTSVINGYFYLKIFSLPQQKFSNLNLKVYSEGQEILTKKNKNYQVKLYKFWYRFVVLAFISAFSSLFFSDIYLTFSLMMV
jgi:NADH:ubiquinone oxidoreductase subunit 2 (subunit N)